MAINATYVSSDTLTALYDATGQKDLRAQCPAGVAIKADCGEDGVKYGVVTAVSYDDPVTTIVITGDALTANLVAFEHGNDTPASLANHGHMGATDGGQVAHASLSGAGSNTHAQIDAHLAAGDNPHAVTAAQIGAKGLISSNTTIYVATTGSDTTGDGSSSAPFASIAQALASIKDKLIASGVTLTIQVADGTYTISSSITIDHPDADKIQLLGNTSTETTVGISAIDVDAKTVTVAGDYTGSLQAGDIIWLKGSSTSALNGAYLVSGVSYDSSNTIITCASETFASSTVGGGSIVIKPCNRCNLIFENVHGFIISSVKIFTIKGFKISSPGGSYRGLYSSRNGKAQTPSNIIFYNWNCGVYSGPVSYFYISGAIFKNCTTGIYAVQSNFTLDNLCTLDGSTTGVWAIRVSIGASLNTIIRNCAAAHSPALNTSGNNGSYIASS